MPLEADVDGLVRHDHALMSDLKGMLGKREQTWLFLFERRLDRPLGVIGPPAVCGHLVTPPPDCAVQVGHGGDAAACEKGLTQIADGTFDTALLVAACRPARTRLEVIPTGQFQIAGMKAHLRPAAFEHSRAKVVDAHRAGHSPEALEGPAMAEQEAFGLLVEKELDIKSARVREGHHERREASLPSADRDRTEVGPIGLGLLAWERAQAQVGFGPAGTELVHRAPHLPGRAGKAALPEHGVDVGRP